MTVEVVELERIPNTTDVLGVYEVTVDKNGDLTGYPTNPAVLPLGSR